MIWGIVVKGISSVLSGYFEVKKSKQEAEIKYQSMLAQGEQDWDIEAMKASKYSWKDELITIIWYSPLVVGWYDAEKDGLRDAREWVDFVGELPYWWQIGAFGIMAASFGLRWYFKQQDFKVK
jgi:hypothetical protein